MLKAEFQQQLNAVKESIGDSLQAMKGQIAKVQQSQAQMWGAISRMGEALQGMAARENDSDSECEEEEATLEASPAETSAPRTRTSPIPLFGVPSPLVHVDAMSVRDSVSSAMPRQPAAPLLDAEAGKADAGLSVGKAHAATKEKFILDPMVGTTPPHVDYTVSWSGGDDVSLVEKPPNVATTSAGGSAALIAAGGQVNIEAPPRYSGKRQPGVRIWLTQMECYMRLMKYSPSDWLDIVAMRVEGATSSWVNAVLQDVAASHRAAFLTWRSFTQAMIHRFEPVTRS